MSASRKDRPKCKDRGSSLHVAFSWAGLPDYAARCIGRFSADFNGSLTVIATQPSVPIRGMENSIGRKINWISEEKDSVQSWSDFGVETPDLFFQSGTFVPSFNKLGDECRSMGKPVILLSDNNWTGSLKQRFAQPIRHRLLLRSKFTGALVPGRSGQKYMLKMGYKPKTVLCGMYGADARLFSGGEPCFSRPKKMIYVGQFIERKNVVMLARTFGRFAEVYPEWNLVMCGNGSQKAELVNCKNVTVTDFVQPEELAGMLKQARCLILPSVEEHWGVVVHEASLSGCALLLSNSVGASADLATTSNAILFSARNEEQLFQSLVRFARWSEEQWDSAESMSRNLGANFGPDRFAESVHQFCSLALDGSLSCRD